MKKLIYLLPALFLSINTGYGQLPSNVPTEGLIGFWSFTQNANDDSGNNQNGAVTGAVLTQDRFGNENNAYDFSCELASEARIDIDLNEPSQTNGLTVSYWVIRADGDNSCGSTGRTLEFWNNENQYECQFQNIESKSYVSHTLANGEFLVMNLEPIESNVWTHIVYTHNSQVGRYYIDGNIVGEVALVGEPHIATDMAIGRMNHPAYDEHEGLLDDIGVWNRVLTQQEITDLYESEVLSTTGANYESNINIYPNPANDQITIDFGNLDNVEDWNIKIINILGQEVLSHPMNTDKINVSELSKGVYIIRISDGINLTDKKFIKN